MRPRKLERGNVAATVALFLVGLIGTLALAMNVGHLMSVRGELQNAADAAALSGAGLLNGTSAHAAAAHDTAVTYGQRNATDSHVKVDVQPSDVEVGHWGRLVQNGPMVFTRLDPVTGDPMRINAVRVASLRNAQRGGGPVEVFFGAFLGRSQADASALAIAVRGGPTNLACMTLPLAVSNCEFPFTCEKTTIISWSSDGTDEVAWTEGIIGNVNTADLVTILRNIGPTDNCDQPLSTDTWITVNNGVKNAACMELRALWQRYSTRTYFIPKVYVDPCPPGGTAFHQDNYPVDEFIAVEITGVCCGDSGDAATCKPSESPDGKSKYMKLVMHCGVQPPAGSSGTGGGFTSVSPQPPGLAQ